MVDDIVPVFGEEQALISGGARIVLLDDFGIHNLFKLSTPYLQSG